VGTMTRFSKYDIVKVVHLHEVERSVQGSKDVTRQPKVGDVGTIVHVPPNSDLFDSPIYVVECVNDAGMTIWLADFQEDELEIVVYES
jgi:hypothetical protein